MRGLAGKNVDRHRGGVGHRRACAARLLEEGASVIGADLATPADPAPAADGGAWAFHHGRRDRRGVGGRLVDEAATSARVDGVVNAAGVAGGGPVHLVDAAEWNRVLRRQPHRHLPDGQARPGPHARASRRATAQRGCVVTIASIEGSRAPPGAAPTARRRAASCILTKNMAIDYAGAASGSTRSARASSTRR